MYFQKVLISEKGTKIGGKSVKNTSEDEFSDETKIKQTKFALLVLIINAKIFIRYKGKYIFFLYLISVLSIGQQWALLIRMILKNFLYLFIVTVPVYNKYYTYIQPLT